MLSLVSVRRAVANDTKSAQAAVMFLTALTIAGILASDKPLRFDIGAIDASNVIPLTLFTFCLLGGGYAVDFTTGFFHRIVDFVMESNPAASSEISFAFAEMNTPDAHSSVSGLDSGFSRMRAHIEDGGHRVLTVEKASAVSIRRMRRTVIVVPRTTGAMSGEEIQFYRDFVRRGNGMLIMTDQQDAAYKKSLLSNLDIVLRLPQAEEELPDTCYLNLNLGGEIEDIGRIQPILRSPVYINLDDGSDDSFESTQGDNDNRNTTLVIHNIGKGIIVAIGSVDHWANKHFDNLSNDDNVLFLDYIQDILANRLGGKPACSSCASN